MVDKELGKEVRRAVEKGVAVILKAQRTEGQQYTRKRLAGDSEVEGRVRRAGDLDLGARAELHEADSTRPEQSDFYNRRPARRARAALARPELARRLLCRVLGRPRWRRGDEP